MFNLMTRAAHEAAIADLRDDFRQAERAYDAERAASVKRGRLAAELLAERDAAHATLREVAGLETPSCAHIGKRMAAKAREGLPEFTEPRPF